MSDNIRHINPPQAVEQLSEEEVARRATWDGYVDEDELTADEEDDATKEALCRT